MSGYDWRNKCVFSFCRNTVSDEADVMSSGRLFHCFEPAEANDRSSVVTRRDGRRLDSKLVGSWRPKCLIWEGMSATQVRLTHWLHSTTHHETSMHNNSSVTMYNSVCVCVCLLLDKHVERTSSDVLISPLDHYHVSTRHRRTVAHHVGLGTTDMVDWHVVTRTSWTQHSDQQQVTTYNTNRQTDIYLFI